MQENPDNYYGDLFPKCKKKNCENTGISKSLKYLEIAAVIDDFCSDTSKQLFQYQNPNSSVNLPIPSVGETIHECLPSVPTGPHVCYFLDGCTPSNCDTNSQISCQVVVKTKTGKVISILFIKISELNLLLLHAIAYNLSYLN